MDVRWSGYVFLTVCLTSVVCVNSLPIVRFVTPAAMEVEEGTTPYVTILSFPMETEIVVKLEINHTSSSSDDIWFSSLLLTISANRYFVDFQFTITDDSLDETDETFEINILPDPAYELGDKNKTTVTIKRSDQPTFSLQLGSATEGITPFTITIKSDFAVANPKTVSFTFGGSGSTAVDGIDYTSNGTNNVHFFIGNSSQSFDVMIIDDTLYEGLETFVVTLTPSLYYLTGPQFAYAINDNDLPEFYMKEKLVTVREGYGKVNVTVIRDEVPGIVLPAVTVKLEAVDKTATSADYNVSNPISVEFQPNQLESTAEITIIDDSLEESSENFEVSIKPDPAYTVQANKTTTVVRIYDDEFSTITTKKLSQVVDEDDGTISIAIVRTFPNDGAVTPLTVNLAVTAGTATANDDYETPSTLSIDFPSPSPGTTSDEQLFNITIKQDDLFEPDETFTVSLVDVDIYILGTTKTTEITIKNDEEPVFEFVTGEMVVNESAGSVTVSVKMTNRAANAPAYSVDIKSGDVTATEDTDYEFKNYQSVVFQSSATQSFSFVEIIDDGIDESSEMFYLMFNGSVKTGPVSTMNITINDNDDSQVQWDSTSLTKTEGDPEITLNVSRNNSDSTSPSVSFSLLEGSGTTVISANKKDVDISSMNVVFAKGESVATVKVSIVDDKIHEPDEFLELKMPATAAGITFIGDKTFTLTVKDNDKSKIEFGEDLSLTEGNSKSLTITRVNAESNTPAVTFDLSTAGTATSSDFSLDKTSITFPEGSTIQTITISTTDDTIVENNETVIVKTDSTKVETGTKSQQTITIVDNDKSKVHFEGPDDISVSENDISITNLTVVRSNSDSTSPEVQVTFNKNYSGATDNDFNDPPPISVTIPEGQSKGFYVIKVRDDNQNEPKETLLVTIENTEDVEPEDNKKVAFHIIDDDLPLIKFKSVTISVPESAGSATFTLVRSNTASNSPAVTVQLTATSGTATDTEDFQSSSIENVTFAVGMNETSGTIDILDDALDENDESFTISIKENNEVVQDGDNLTVTITDDDKTKIEFVETSYNKTEDVGDFNVTVKRSNSNGNSPAVSVTFVLVPGLAGPNDYALPMPTVTIEENEEYATVSVHIEDDKIDETDEDFTITIQASSDVEKADTNSVALIIIIDNDLSTFEFRDSKYTVTEGGTLTVTVDRTDDVVGTTNITVNLNVTYTNGEISRNDLVSDSLPSLFYKAGVKSQSFDFTIKDDNIVERNEIVSLFIINSPDYKVGTISETLVTVEDNDVSEVQFKTDLESVTEGDAFLIELLRFNAQNNSPPVNVTLKVKSGAGTASTSDYTLPSTFVASFVQGGMAASVGINIVDDNIDEPEENFIIEFVQNAGLYKPVNIKELTVRIKDNDISNFTFTSATYKSDESANVVISISRVAPIGNVGVTVYFQINHVTTSQADLGAVPSSVTFSASSQTQTVTIPIIDDNKDEIDETFTLTLVPMTDIYDVIGNVTTTITIVDNDVPTISLETPSPTYESLGPLVLTGTRTNGLIGEISVDLSFSDVTALAGKDYIKPDAAKLVFADGEASKSIEIQLKDDIKEEHTETFNVSIVDDADKFSTGVKEVTAQILDDDGPATYDCRRPGQKPCSNGAVCNDKGICECNALDPPRGGYKCDYVKGDVDKNPCTKTSCSEHGTCVAVDGKAKCYCDAGYEDTEKCLFPRYKVICGENQMAIQIDPIGNFQGKVYAYGYEDTCTFDDFNNQTGMPVNFTSGKVKIIPNIDTNCGNTTSMVMDNILRIYRLIYVQYNSQFQAAYDEFVRARCYFDLTKNITLVSLISPVSASQADTVQASAQGHLNPFDLGVTKDGAAVSSGTPIRMGEKLMVVLTVNQGSEFGALLVVDLTIDNNVESDPIVITIVENSCFKDVAGIMSPTTSLMVTPDNGVLKIEFEFRPPKFKNSDDVRIKVVAKLCPKNDITPCNLPASCSSNRRKRSADQYGDKTVEYVFKVSDPAGDRVLANDGSVTNRASSEVSGSNLTCENEISAGILAAIGMLGVLLLLFVVLSIALFCSLIRRKDKSKVGNIPSSTTLPTKVVYH